jgi:hypothetical protein
MMRTMVRALLVGALVAIPSGLVAQEAPGERAERLRDRVEAVFVTRLRQDLGLNDAQTQQVGAVLTEWGATRRQLEVEERALRRALDGQLRPGVAADGDSVTRVVDRLLQNRVEYAASFQGEMRALAPILTPVQRAQFLRLRDTILQRVRELQEQRPVPGRPVRSGTP